MKKILILTDNKNRFLLSLKNNKFTSMNINNISNFFISNGYEVLITKFCDLDMKANYKGVYVLYQTSELIGQFYKHYIEDIVYYLEQNGAIVLPKYKYLKAHHNKGFMELLRLEFSDESLKTINSRYYGTPEKINCEKLEFPVVIKQNSGAGSQGVYKANNLKELYLYSRKASAIVVGDNYFTLLKQTIKNLIKKLINKVINNMFFDIHNIYKPIIVQNYISNLKGDYKVLYFGGKYYTLYRENRKNDFRASGSGLLNEVPYEENFPLLDYAEKVVMQIDFPIVGMDIGYDGNQYHLLEFQMIHLGPYTLQNSKYYFIRKGDGWQCIREEPDLEREFSRSILKYIDEKCGDDYSED